jgi:hypothetical protein
MTEQKTEQPKRKVGKFVAPLVAAALTTAGLTGCPQPTEPDPKPIPDQPTHVHQWGPEVWENESGIEWQAYETIVAATKEKKGTGRKTGKQEGTQVCQLDGTVKDISKIVTQDFEIPVGKVLNANGTFSNMPQTETELPAWKSIPNVDVLHELDGGGDRRILKISNARPLSVVGGILPTFKEQADMIKTWLDSVQFVGADAALAEKFAALSQIEQSIGNDIAATNEPGANKPLTGYADRMDGYADAVWDTIFGNSGAARDQFDKCAQAYAAYDYIYTRDWNTAPDELTGRAAEYRQAVIDAGFEDPGIGTTFMSDRDLRLPLGTSRQGLISTSIHDQIVKALGLTGDNATKTRGLATGLIVQLIQDKAEFSAFIDDLVAAPSVDASKNFNAALNYNYGAQISQAAPQPSVKLAGLNRGTNFAPDAIKTAYGKPFEQYTGDFVPYKKDEKSV